jgi:hypothetical protein
MNLANLAGNHVSLIGAITYLYNPKSIRNAVYFWSSFLKRRL